MRIRIASDLHAEFWSDEEPVMGLHGNFSEIVLIIAGDLHPGKPCIWILKQFAKEYRAVIFVPGNHEYYGEDIIELSRVFSRVQVPNLHILNPGAIAINGVTFIGATLWTDLDHENHEAMMLVEEYMNDFYQSWCAGKPFSARQFVKLHHRDRTFIEKHLASISGNHTVVVTHHLPSWRCLPEGFENDPLNPAYAANCDDLIEKYRPSLWIHGHRHVSMRHKIGDTVIICNPFGYFPRQVNRDFDQEMMIEV